MSTRAPVCDARAMARAAREPEEILMSMFVMYQKWFGRVYRRAGPLAILVAVAACARAPRPMSTADTIALLGEVVKYAADSLGLGPRVAVARTTTSTPSVPLSVETHAKLVAS